MVLAEGVYDGDYTGAVLPPDSAAGEWPWRSTREDVPV
jgi:hypothetical protein